MILQNYQEKLIYLPLPIEHEQVRTGYPIQHQLQKKFKENKNNVLGAKHIQTTYVPLFQQLTSFENFPGYS